MTSDKLDLDPIQALILEAFWAALAQLDSASALPAELREEINQVGEALANHQVDAVVRLFTEDKVPCLFLSMYKISLALRTKR
jgi:hypothetical protein